jgi:hypothetical protein
MRFGIFAVLCASVPPNTLNDGIERGVAVGDFGEAYECRTYGKTSIEIEEKLSPLFTKLPINPRSVQLVIFVDHE